MFKTSFEALSTCNIFLRQWFLTFFIRFSHSPNLQTQFCPTLLSREFANIFVNFLNQITVFICYKIAHPKGYYITMGQDKAKGLCGGTSKVQRFFKFV